MIRARILRFKEDGTMANINPNCPCKNVGCPRHGNCEECKANHHASGGLTACERLAKEQEEKKD